jgi:hypothetical protein
MESPPTRVSRNTVRSKCFVESPGRFSRTDANRHTRAVSAALFESAGATLGAPSCPAEFAHSVSGVAVAKDSWKVPLGATTVTLAARVVTSMWTSPESSRTRSRHSLGDVGARAAADTPAGLRAASGSCPASTIGCATAKTGTTNTARALGMRMLQRDGIGYVGRLTPKSAAGGRLKMRLTSRDALEPHSPRRSLCIARPAR